MTCIGSRILTTGPPGKSLTQQTFTSHSFGGSKFKIKVPADSVPCESLLSSLKITSSCWVFTWQRERALVFLPLLIITSWGPTTMTSSDPNYLPKSQLANTVILGIRTGFPGGIVVRNPPANAEDVEDRDVGLIPGWERSPRDGNGNQLSIAAWRIPWTEEGAWWAMVHGVARSQTWLSTQQHRDLGLNTWILGEHRCSPQHSCSLPLLTVAQLTGHFLKRSFANTCLTLMSKHYILSFCVTPYSITDSYLML